MSPEVLQYPTEQPEAGAECSSHQHHQTDPAVLQQKQGYAAGEGATSQSLLLLLPRIKPQDATVLS